MPYEEWLALNVSENVQYLGLDSGFVVVSTAIRSSFECGLEDLDYAM